MILIFIVGSWFDEISADLGPILFAGEATVIVDPNATITIPGNYRLADNLVVTVTGITIASDDVFLDLNSHELISGGGFVGIALGSTRFNVTIKNGIIRNLPTGISTTSGVLPSNNLIFENIAFINCSTVGMSLNNVTDTRISQCIFDGGAGIGMSFSTVSQAKVENCSSSNHSGVGGVGVQISSSNKIVIQNSEFFSDGGGGVLVSSSTQMTIQDCKAGSCTSFGFNTQNSSQIIMQNCSAQACTVLGFGLNNSTQILYENCTAFNTTGNTATGFLNFQCTDVQYDNCTSTNAIANAGAGIGFNVDNIPFPSTTNSFKLIYRNCIANDNTGSTSGIGFNFIQAFDSCIVDCFAKQNAGTSLSVGIDASECVRLTMRNNTLINNNAALPNSFGIRFLTGGTLDSVILNNVAQQHVTANYSSTGGTIRTVNFSVSAGTFGATPTPFDNINVIP